MRNCDCIECNYKCYEYYNNSTSDKAYYEWTYKQDKCLQAESEKQRIGVKLEIRNES